ncbi:MAG TPA: hypothetical protein P5160_08160 [Candidatus Omnitrophota bacterium]|nr:hypothetical protein [Candidatus Omnitrophota bacterium]
MNIHNTPPNTALAKMKELALVSVLFLALTLLMTFPLAAHFSTHLIGNKGDSWQHAWNMWWMNKTLTEHVGSPFQTDYLFYPKGVTLAFNDMSFFNSGLSIPLQRMFNLFAAYNTMFLVSFVLSGLGMYLLALYLTKDKPAAFLAGCIFVFCPYRMGHSLGHLSLVSTQFIPFFALFFLKSINAENRSDMVFAALFLILTSFCNWYYLVFCTIFVLLYLIFILFTDRSLLAKAALKTALIFTGTLIILSPIFFILLRAALTTQFIGAHDPQIFSADILSYFIPGAIQNLGRFKAFADITSQFTGNTAENSNYIGYSVLLLSAIAFVRLRKKDRLITFLTICSAVFLILSLGINPHLKGGVHTSITLPYKILYDNLFFFKFTGMPARFLIMLMFCLSLLSAFGIKALRLSVPAGHKQKTVFIALLFAVLAEYASLPYLMTSFPGSPFFETMRQDTEDYGVIYLPHNTPRALYYQTLHNKKMMGGYLSRTPFSAYHDILNPALKHLFLYSYPFEAITDAYSHERTRALTKTALHDLEIKFIILENDRANYFLQSLRIPIFYTDEIITVYKP